MAVKKKMTVNLKSVGQGRKSSTKAKSLNLVDQLSMVATLDEDEFVSFDSNGDAVTSNTTPVSNDTARPSKIPVLSPKKNNILSKTNTLSLSQLHDDVEKLFKQKDTTKLLELDKKLKTDFYKELESKYESQLDKANKLINQLMMENESLKSQQIIPPLKDSNVIFDIIELLTNLSCTDFIEDDEKMQFTLRQVGNEIEMNYKLIIYKSEKMDEILYVPIFDNNDKENDDTDVPQVLRKRLPDYLLEELKFPSSNLSNFYNKMNRSLNKSI